MARWDPPKSAEQQVVVKLLRWNRWAALQGIQPAEGGIESIKSLICQPANPPERMTRRDPLLDRNIGEQGVAALMLASYQRLDSCPIPAEEAGFFSELLNVCANHVLGGNLTQGMVN